MTSQIIKKRLIQLLWLLFAIAMVVLFVVSNQYKKNKLCQDIKVDIIGGEGHVFIDEKDIIEQINPKGYLTKTAIKDINIQTIENQLLSNPWIKKAELFFDKHQVLQMSITERYPIARIFCADGNSFYIDTAAIRLPLSSKLSVRVPVFTGFPSNNKKMPKADSLLLNDVRKVAVYLAKDSFWQAQIAQVEIAPNTTFILYPTLGDHKIEIGKAEELGEKFNRLYTFYKKAWLQNASNYYNKINVAYKNQVVASKKGFVAPISDSARIVDSLIRQTTALTDSSLVITTATKKKDVAKTVTKSPLTKAGKVKEIVKKNHANKPLLNNKKTVNPLSNMKHSKPETKPLKH